MSESVLPAGPATEPAVTLTTDESAWLADRLDRLPADPGSEDFLLGCRELARALPARIRQAVATFRRAGVTGVLWIRGLPCDPDLPPTPTDPTVPPMKPTRRSEGSLGVVGELLGHSVGYAQEKSGQIFQNLVPTANGSTALSSESSAVPLDFHTEMAFHPHRPDYLLLCGLRTDPDRSARTTFAAAREVVPQLSSVAQAHLRRRQFAAGVDYSFGNRSTRPGAGPVVRVLRGASADPRLICDWELMVSQTPEGKSALAQLRAAVGQVYRSVLLEPGTLLVLDNYRAVHGRTVFRARFDGTDRWVQRTAVVRDLARSAADRRAGGRVIATDFSSYLI